MIHLDRGEPQVRYIDSGAGAVDHYDILTNQIVLNRQLQEYPLAQSYVLSHEFKHYDLGANLLGQLWHELKNDLVLAFSADPAVEELREYRETYAVDSEIRRNMTSAFLVILFRSCWQLVLTPAGWLYRTVKHRGSGEGGG